MESEILAWKIRRDVLEMAHSAHASHVGSAFSVADIVAVLYTYFADLEQIKNGDKKRTRIILSKGHAGTAIYAALAEVGLTDKNELQTYGMNGSKLSCHVSHRGVKGVEISTGSLGQGVCMAAGIALAGKKAGLNYRTFVITGDGECNEGSVWEMILFARQQKLNNLTLIIDRNGLQGGGKTSEILDTEDLAEKIRAFGWNIVGDQDYLRECYKLKAENISELSKCFKRGGLSELKSAVIGTRNNESDLATRTERFP